LGRRNVLRNRTEEAPKGFNRKRAGKRPPGGGGFFNVDFKGGADQSVGVSGALRGEKPKRTKGKGKMKRKKLTAVKNTTTVD